MYKSDVRVTLDDCEAATKLLALVGTPRFCFDDFVREVARVRRGGVELGAAEAVARIEKYLAERAKVRQHDQEEIHSFHMGDEAREAALRVSDIGLLLAIARENSRLKFELAARPLWSTRKAIAERDEARTDLALAVGHCRRLLSLAADLGHDCQSEPARKATDWLAQREAPAA